MHPLDVAGVFLLEPREQLRVVFLARAHASSFRRPERFCASAGRAKMAEGPLEHVVENSGAEHHAANRVSLRGGAVRRGSHAASQENGPGAAPTVVVFPVDDVVVVLHAEPDRLERLRDRRRAASFHPAASASKTEAGDPNRGLCRGNALVTREIGDGRAASTCFFLRARKHAPVCHCEPDVGVSSMR